MSQTKAQLIDAVDGSIVTADLADDAVNAAKLASNAVVNASVDASAAIAGSKINPSFTSNVTITNTAPALVLVDSDHNSDFNIQASGGLLNFNDSTNSATRISITSDGKVNFGSVARVEVDGVFKSAHGSAATPAYNFLNDNDNGMFRATTNTIGFSTAGTDRVRINSSGHFLPATDSTYNIGADATRFANGYFDTLYGDGSNLTGITGITIANNTNNRIITATGNANSINAETNLTFSGTSLIQSGNHVLKHAITDSSGLKISQEASNVAQIFNHYAGPMTFGVNNTEKMRIDSSGRVGIGTTSPTTLLNLNVDTEANLGSGSEGIRLTSGSSNAQFVRLGSSYSNNSVTGPGTLLFSSNKLSLRCDNGNPITFHTGSTVAERMRINSSGSVLIGTTSDSIFNDTSGGGFNLKANGQLVLAKQATSAADPLVWLNDTGQTTNKSIVFAQDGSEKANIGLAGNNVTISVNGSERMRIASDGKVGIGGTTPDTAFHIEKLTPELRVQSTNTNLGQGSTVCTFSHHTSDPTTPTGVGEVFRIKSYSANSNGADYTTELVSRAGSGGGQSRIALGQGAVGAITFSTNASSSATERMRIDKDGKVGIGVSSPTAKLHIGDNDSGTTDMLILHANADGAGENNGIASIKLMGDSEHAAFIKGGHTSNGNTILTFHTDAHDSGKNPQERMRILDDGGVVINATSRPVVGTEFLGVNGGGANNSVGIAATCSDNNGIPFFASNGSNTTSQRLMRFAAGSGGDTRGTITFNGSAMVYGGASDYRLKENITSISNGITKLKDLKPINFNWIKDETNTSIMGFLAHEVQEVMPQVVVGTKDEVNSEGKPEYQEIDLGGISPLIVAALQEAVAKIETLETEVAALKAA
jgi:phosphotransferase system IIB component